MVSGLADTTTMPPIFIFASLAAVATGKSIGTFRPTGIRPQIINRLFDMGVTLPPDLMRLFPERRQAQQSFGPPEKRKR